MEDTETIWIQITSGQGPDECCWVVGRLAEVMIKELGENGYKLDTLEAVCGGHKGTFKSVLIAVDGQDTSQLVEKWHGSVQWVGKSMFRPTHKRRNWFVGVDFYQLSKTPTIKNENLKFEAMRSSGPGGQHTNKTESAVRVTHIPSGLQAVSQEERSQHLNKKLALTRLYEKLQTAKQVAETNQQKQRWNDHASLERGNPIRVYEGLNFKLKKA